RPLKIEIEIKDTMDSEKVINEIERANNEIKFLKDYIMEITLAEGVVEHWAHIEGEVIIKLDKLYRPLKIEIEIKDTMDSEKVLMHADLL
ncbi:hypothetical protein DMP16_02795, partial [Sulfolobus sp. B1]